jgi:Zn-dependent protease/CBS domain-containing protein
LICAAAANRNIAREKHSMLESSIQLGRILGIRVGIHYTWFIIFALISLSLSTHFQHVNPDWSATSAWATAIITSLLFFASIVLHEFGHSIVAMAHGIPVQSITLFIFGGVAQTTRDAQTAKSEFWIAIAGPVVSLLLAGIFLLLGGFLTKFSAQAGQAAHWLATINFMVAIFNMIPGFPLDGGRVFRSLVWGATHDANKGMRWAVNAGKLVAYAMMGFGFFIVITTGYVINGLWLGLIGWFLLTAAEASGRQYALDHMIRGGHAQEVMESELPVVPADLSVAQWVDDYVLGHGARAFLVEEDNHVIGLITLSDARKIERERWDATGITEVMTPRARLHTVPPHATLPQIMQAMQRYGVNQMPVAASSGEILGWIDRDRLLTALKVYAEVSR